MSFYSFEVCFYFHSRVYIAKWVRISKWYWEEGLSFRKKPPSNVSIDDSRISRKLQSPPKDEIEFINTKRPTKHFEYHNYLKDNSTKNNPFDNSPVRFQKVIYHLKISGRIRRDFLKVTYETDQMANQLIFEKINRKKTYGFPAFVKEYKGCSSQLYQDQKNQQNRILCWLKDTKIGE